MEWSRGHFMNHNHFFLLFSFNSVLANLHQERAQRSFRARSWQIWAAFNAQSQYCADQQDCEAKIG